MFTGIIEQKAKVLIAGNRLVIESQFDDIQAGESVSVNGVCLTVLPKSKAQLAFDLSPETLRVTTLGSIKVGDFVNLERAMLASTRFGGHYVSGHVDAKASVESIETIGDFIDLKLSNFAPDELLYLVPKGSVCVDGVSLTINTVQKSTISLMLVPHTLVQTSLGELKVGQLVNIEFDYLTRVVAHQLQLAGKLNKEVAL